MRLSKVWGVGGMALMSSLVLSGFGMSSAANAAVRADNSKSPVVVTIWYGLGGALGTDFKNMVYHFNRTHPSIKVEADYEGSYTGGGALQQKLLAAVASHTVPDLAQMEVHSLPVFASQGALQPLTPFIAKTPNDQSSRFLPGMEESTAYKGVTYGIPFNRSLPVIFYNETMFKAHHLTPPQTWTQLAADAKILTSGSGKSKIYGFSPLDQWWFWEVYTWESGSRLLNSSLTKAEFATDKTANLFNLTVDMVKDGDAIVQSGSEGWALTTASVYEGQVAMDEDSSASMATIADNVGNKFQWGVDMIPAGPAGRHVPPGGANLVMMSGLPQSTQNAAWTFLKWMSEPAQSMAWSEETGYLPTKNEIISSKPYKRFLAAHPQMRVVLAEAKYQEAPPESPHYLGIVDYVQDEMDAMYFNHVAPIKALQEAQQEANALLSSGS
jgi:sn-glycerol 3-phosphate transport system substrate-binding protein